MNQQHNFGTVQNIHTDRSKFMKPHNLKTTINVGDLIPIYVDEVLPGDTFKLSASTLARLSTLINPAMDELYIDTYAFEVRSRLLWDKFPNFMGENDTDHWFNEADSKLTYPTIVTPINGFKSGSIMDYLGIPTDVQGIEVNHMPLRAVVLTYNEFFRNQNLQDPYLFYKTSGKTQGVDTLIDPIQNCILGGAIPSINKTKDYFTSALPAPQKGAEVELPLGLYAPIVPTQHGPDGQPVALNENFVIGGAGADSQMTVRGPFGGLFGKGVTALDRPAHGSVSHASGELEADLSHATAASINDLRLAFQIQRMLEKDARGGTRYTEMLETHFGVRVADAVLQRPVLLAANRKMLNIQQVAATSQAGKSDPQLPTDKNIGDLGAFSVTGNPNGLNFTKTFGEHGYIVILAAVRQKHTYQQGISKMFLRQTRLDVYDPVFANIGEQPIENQEIYYEDKADSTKTFGYKEPWSEYKTKPNMITGQFRSTSTQALDSWHAADVYNATPALNANWIKETPKFVDRLLAVKSSLAPQVLLDAHFDVECTRKMPLYSIPGLIDHN